MPIQILPLITLRKWWWKELGEEETDRRKKVNNSQPVAGWLVPQRVASDWTMMKVMSVWVMLFDQTTWKQCQHHFEISAKHLYFLALTAGLALNLSPYLSPPVRRPASGFFSISICLSHRPLLLPLYLCRNNITAGVRSFADECGRGLFSGQSERENLGVHAVLPHLHRVQAFPHWRLRGLLQLSGSRPEPAHHFSRPHRFP